MLCQRNNKNINKINEYEGFLQTVAGSGCLIINLKWSIIDRQYIWGCIDF